MNSENLMFKFSKGSHVTSSASKFVHCTSTSKVGRPSPYAASKPLSRRSHISRSRLPFVVHEVIGAPDINEDDDELLLEEASNLYRLPVCIAGKSMNHIIIQLQIFLYVLVLVLEVLLFLFRFINGFNQEKSSLLTSMVVAPWHVTMPTQPLRGSITKLFSHKFILLRRSVESGWGWRSVCYYSWCRSHPPNILIKPLLLKSCEGSRCRIGLLRLNFSSYLWL
ncbi:hypothetical protein BHM03_00042697 [Ensete ventricosum]|nr:hypothetical protein BHM03_00042697 [Ensete ventricosum]